MIEKDVGVLRLAEEAEPFRRLNRYVKPETAQQIRIVRRCVSDAIFAFDARTVFAAEAKPARQSVIQALNREQPGSGFVAIEYGLGYVLTLRWLCESAAEAEERNNRKRAKGCHIQLCDLNARQGPLRNRAVS
jgi:hypothetical protein